MMKLKLKMNLEKCTNPGITDDQRENYVIVEDEFVTFVAEGKLRKSKTVFG